MATLWAWATAAPHPDSPVDHTWVTDYDNRVDDSPPSIADVVGASTNFWFCWGPFHALGDGSRGSHGYLGSKSGSVALARCVCLPNAPCAPDKPTCGTVPIYGIDGLCHQLANQVLWATASRSQQPLTVASARGYGASTFFYGTYGLLDQAWAARRAACSKAPSAAPNGRASTMNGSPSPNDDEFAEMAATVLARRSSDRKLPALLALRRQAQEKLINAPPETRTSADALNDILRFHLHRAASLLNDTEYIDVFGFAKSAIADVELVDPGNFGKTRAVA